MLRTFPIAVVLVLVGLTARADGPKGGATVPPAITEPQLAFFETKIRPVLVEHCYECHAVGAKIIQGGLRVDHREGLLRGGDSGPAVVAGDAGASLLLKALRYEEFEMPPKGKLPDAVIRDFEAWVAMGLPDPRQTDETVAKSAIDIEAGRKHWAFQPIADPPAPDVRDANWPLDPVDRFLLARLEQSSLNPVPDADRYTWLRRVSLDLTGLPAAPEDIASFVKDDSPEAQARVVDRLLGSRAYGERWARHWLDLTGYADQVGTSNSVFAEHAWRYRDYLIDALNADKPFDRFLREQIAGDLLPYDSPEERAASLVATGFLVLGDVEIVNPDKLKMETDHIDQQVSKIGTVFLGMTLGCARCHDHKFDPVGLEDYYGMAGILRSTSSTHKIPNGIWSGLNVAELPETPTQTSDRQTREAEHRLKLDGLQAEQQRLNEEQAAIAAELEEPEADKDALTKKRDGNAGRLRELGTAIDHAMFFAPSAPRAFAVHDSDSPEDMAITIRGNPYAPGAIVPRGVLRVAAWTAMPAIPAGQSGRLQLADWLADPRHPLTARVTVNRIWQKLFGEGLVRTVDYFGTRGEEPSHPELLDHLATRFMREGWSQKQLIRALVLTRAYRMSSGSSSDGPKVDPENRLLWRMNRQRLDAEAIRDAMLAVSGELRVSHGGPALPLEYPENSGSLKPSDVNPPSFALRRFRPEQEFERTIYLPVVRSAQPSLARLRDVFDFTQPAQVAGMRSQTVVPTQALFLLNDDQPRSRAKGLAAAVIAFSPEREVRLEQLWLRSFNRPITPEERTDAAAFLDRLTALQKDPAASAADAWTELSHVLLTSNEFLYRL
jgi:hypothetical protein